MSPAIGIICIPFGQGRNFIAREIVKKNLLIFLRRICSLCMTLPEDRDMKSGTMDRRRSWYDGIIGFISERNLTTVFLLSEIEMELQQKIFPIF